MAAPKAATKAEIAANKELLVSIFKEVSDGLPSKSAFLASVMIMSKNDLINYGKIHKNTYKRAITLGKEIDEAYDEFRES